MFEGFSLDRIDVGEAVLRVRHGGAGLPLLLLHGHPRTHTTWHRIAPLLARDHTVVCPDLRGYGESTAPPTMPDHEQASKRAMAHDLLALMRALGHDRFAVAGHDRGCYVAFRLAIDYPQAVTRLAVMDGVPVVEALERCDARFAAAWWHWWFFAQTEKPAEQFISRDPAAWYGANPKQWVPRTTPTGSARSTTRARSSRWSRTTALGLGSTVSTRRPTAPPAAA